MALAPLPVNLSRQVSYFHFASCFWLSLSLFLFLFLSIYSFPISLLSLSEALRLLRICFGERSSGFDRFDTANTRESARSCRIFPVSRYERPCMHLDRREGTAFFPSFRREGAAAVRGWNVNVSRRGRVARIISVNSRHSRVSASPSPKSSLLNF